MKLKISKSLLCFYQHWEMFPQSPDILFAAINQNNKRLHRISDICPTSSNLGNAREKARLIKLFITEVKVGLNSKNSFSTFEDQIIRYPDNKKFKNKNKRNIWAEIDWHCLFQPFIWIWRTSQPTNSSNTSNKNTSNLFLSMFIGWFQVFTRIWPTNQTHKYFRYFKSIPYSEKLMGECYSS